MATQDQQDPPTGEAVRRGLSKPAKVIEYWQGLLSEHPELCQDLQAIREVLSGMSVDDSGTRILNSIAASLLNQEFESSGLLIHVTDDNQVGVVYYEPGPQKDMIWAGLVNL